MRTLAVLFLAATLPAADVPPNAPEQEPAAPPDKTVRAPTSKTPIKIILGNKTTTPATKGAPAAGTKATADTPATKGAADKAGKAAKKEEPPAKIEGMEIPRGAKGFLGLEVANGVFKLSFYDPKKKAIAPDVVRAMFRFNPSYQRNPEIFILTPGEGKTLTVAKTVRPPYNFKLFMSLFAEGVEDPVETYVVDFRQ